MKKILIALLGMIVLAACTKETVTRVEVPTGQNQNEKPQSPEASQGVINGGGGKGVLCRRGGQTSLKLLDIYEGEFMYGLTMLPAPTDEKSAVELAMKVASTHFDPPDVVRTPVNGENLTEYMLKQMLKNIRVLSAGRHLRLVNDSGDPIVEEGCNLVQVAVYYDENVLMVDKEYWDMMTWLDRSALLLHEMIYFQDRANGAKTSISTRKLVAHLFSTTPLTPKYAGVPADPSLSIKCFVAVDYNPKAYFYAYEKPANGGLKDVELVFESLNNSSGLFHTTAPFPGTLEHLKPEFTGSYTAQTTIKIDGSQRLMTIVYERRSNTQNTLMTVIDAFGNTLFKNAEVTCLDPVPVQSEIHSEIH